MNGHDIRMFCVYSVCCCFAALRNLDILVQLLLTVNVYHRPILLRWNDQLVNVLRHCSLVYLFNSKWATAWQHTLVSWRVATRTVINHMEKSIKSEDRMSRLGAATKNWFIISSTAHTQYHFRRMHFHSNEKSKLCVHYGVRRQSWTKTKRTFNGFSTRKR